MPHRSAAIKPEEARAWLEADGVDVMRIA